MSNTADFMKAANAIQVQMKASFKNISRWDILDEAEPDYNNPDDILIARQLNRIFELLEEASDEIEYLNKEVKYVGPIHINENGKYECPEKTYSCGSRIEYYVEADGDEPACWAISTVEHSVNHNGYYITRCPDMKMEGLLVRVR